MDELWRKTQDPALHQRWDLRFTEIAYLPRPDESEPQRFLYATRIGFGVGIRGEGETSGSYADADQRVSALTFWSDDPKSLIQKGSGYWKYLRQEDGSIRFLTWYDYHARFGALGRIVDRVALRPLLGWATAWSFDRLRLWIERAIAPEASLRASVVYALARGSIALIWLYHGLVPKLLMHQATEALMLTRAGVAPETAETLVNVAGIVEIGLGLLTLLAWRWRWPLLLTVALMVAALAGSVRYTPELVVAAFNPVSLNLAVSALAAIAYVIGVELPSARRCLRRPPERTR
jgi:hypothetical protein